MTTTTTPTYADVEALVRRQREARSARQPIPPVPREWDLSGAVLWHAVLSGADLREADFPGAELSGSDLRYSDIRDAVLRGANLRGAGLSGAVLSGADLRGAVLRGADLSGAGLSGADLSGVDIREADLSGAELSGSDLRDADLSGARVTEGTVAAAIAGYDSGYRWHAVRLAGGVVILWYGCDRAPLQTWRGRGPEYGARHGHPPAHWATGPAVAIAAAEALRRG